MIPEAVVSYGKRLAADPKVNQPTTNPATNAEYWMRNHYLCDPCFILVIEKQFQKSSKDFTVEEMAQLYPIWEDGIRMGRYCEATKDAEGS